MCSYISWFEDINSLFTPQFPYGFKIISQFILKNHCLSPIFQYNMKEVGKYNYASLGEKEKLQEKEEGDRNSPISLPLPLSAFMKNWAVIVDKNRQNAPKFSWALKAHI